MKLVENYRGWNIFEQKYDGELVRFVAYELCGVGAIECSDEMQPFFNRKALIAKINAVRLRHG